MYIIEIWEQGIYNAGHYNKPDKLAERLVYISKKEAENDKKRLKLKYNMKEKYGEIIGNGYELIEYND